MSKKYALGLALASALAAASPAIAQQDSELAKLREEMKQLQKTYEERMQALEKRLAEAEARVGKAEQTATAAPAVPPPASPAASASAFNPAISLILQGTYARTSQDPTRFAITGFVPSGGEVAPPRRSFGLGESELFITASIDPYFRGGLVAALTPDNDLDVEEAFFQTL